MEYSTETIEDFVDKMRAKYPELKGAELGLNPGQQEIIPHAPPAFGQDFQEDAEANEHRISLQKSQKIRQSGWEDHTWIMNLENLDFISQTWMVIFSCGSIWLLGRREDWRRWGYVAGLISQPAWYFSGFYHHQWGLVLISCWYTYSWVQGVWNFCIRPKKG